MTFEFLVTVEVSRQEGKFASRDDLAEQIRSALEDANPSDLTGENEGTYNIDSWDVAEQTPAKKKNRKRARVTDDPATRGISSKGPND